MMQDYPFPENHLVSRMRAMAEDVDALAVQNLDLTEQVGRLKECLRGIVLGSGHLEVLIGENPPPRTATHAAAAFHYGDDRTGYQAWCCWRQVAAAHELLGKSP